KIVHLMPQEYKLCFQFTGLKMDKELIPIIPASHYTMGGIKVNQESRTNIKSLYAIGECCSNGIHGANRLGGNSLLEIITFGKHLGDNICISDNEGKNIEYPEFLEDKDMIDKLYSMDNTIDFYKSKETLGKMMFKNVGLFKCENKLNKANHLIEQYKKNFKFMGIDDKNKIYNTNLKELLEFKNMVLCAEVIIQSALNRKESRGAHYRDDYPKENNTFSKNTIIKKVKDTLAMELR
ncbi:MAG: FAD-binding protein, partial [Arcobacteraceae bacterium]|nr:FAD-binding protein [Arcobacteraceae bacterium]